MDKKYMEAVSFFPSAIRTRLSGFPEEAQGTVREICIRLNRPVVISAFQGTYFLSRGGGFFRMPPTEPYLVSAAEMEECLRILTEYSMHSFQKELNAGFLTVKGGHRAGIAGSVASEAGEISRVSDINSITLRVARQIKGVGEELCRALFSCGLHSTLLAGSPASGKTTLLRDMARCLSSGLLGNYIKTSLIDERGELAAVHHGAAQNDVGMMTDIFDGYPKGEGMAIAIRSMTPQLLVIDEIATEEDARSIRQSMHAGVAVLASVHAGSMDELHRKTHICRLLAEGAFQNIVLLKGAEDPCRIKQVVSGRELVRQ